MAHVQDAVGHLCDYYEPSEYSFSSLKSALSCVRLAKVKNTKHTGQYDFTVILTASCTDCHNII